MSPDHHPIPRDALPPGWGPAEICDERYVYRRNRPPIDLIAVRTAADHSHPGLGLGQCWELRYRHHIGELSVTEPIGHVPTRQAALEGLLECMDRVHAADDAVDPMVLEAVFDGVRFENGLPAP